MSFTVVEKLNMPFSEDLPFYVPGPKTDDVAFRFASGNITETGSITSWTSDIGAPLRWSMVAGTVTAPRLNIAGKTNFPAAQTSGAAVMSAPNSGVLGASGTLYVTFTPPAGVTERRVMFDFGSMFLHLNNDGRPFLIGSSGSVQTVTDPLVTTNRFSFAVWWNGSTWGTRYNGKSGTATITANPPTRFSLGSSQIENKFAGLYYEISGHTTVHTAAQIDAQLAALKSFYGTNNTI